MNLLDTLPPLARRALAGGLALGLALPASAVAQDARRRRVVPRVVRPGPTSPPSQEHRTGLIPTPEWYRRQLDMQERRRRAPRRALRERRRRQERLRARRQAYLRARRREQRRRIQQTVFQLVTLIMQANSLPSAGFQPVVRQRQLVPYPYPYPRRRRPVIARRQRPVATRSRRRAPGPIARRRRPSPSQPSTVPTGGGSGSPYGVEDAAGPSAPASRPSPRRAPAVADSSELPEPPAVVAQREAAAEERAEEAPQLDSGDLPEPPAVVAQREAAKRAQQLDSGDLPEPPAVIVQREDTERRTPSWFARVGESVRQAAAEIAQAGTVGAMPYGMSGLTDGAPAPAPSREETTAEELPEPPAEVAPDAPWLQVSPGEVGYLWEVYRTLTEEEYPALAEEHGDVGRTGQQFDLAIRRELGTAHNAVKRYVENRAFTHPQEIREDVQGKLEVLDERTAMQRQELAALEREYRELEGPGAPALGRLVASRTHELAGTDGVDPSVEAGHGTLAPSARSGYVAEAAAIFKDLGEIAAKRRDLEEEYDSRIRHNVCEGAVIALQHREALKSALSHKLRLDRQVAAEGDELHPWLQLTGRRLRGELERAERIYADYAQEIERRGLQGEFEENLKALSRPLAERVVRMRVTS